MDEMIQIEPINPYPYGENNTCYRDLFLLVQQATKCINVISSSSFEFAYLLYKIDNKRLFFGYPRKVKPNEQSLGYRCLTISDFAIDYFGISARTCQRFIQIFEYFGDSTTGKIRDEYSKYSYSQLRELVSVECPDGKPIYQVFDYHMTVNQIVEVKKTLKDKQEVIKCDHVVANNNQLANKELTKRDIDAITQDIVLDNVVCEASSTKENDVKKLPLVCVSNKTWTLNNDKSRLDFLLDYENWRYLEHISSFDMDIYKIKIVIDSSHSFDIFVMAGKNDVYYLVNGKIDFFNASYDVLKIHGQPSQNQIVEKLRYFEVKEVSLYDSF